MTQKASIHAVVSGRVQGVYYRGFVRERASQLGLTGYVLNLPGGREVEVIAEGEKEILEKLVEKLKTGPPSARVENISTIWGEYSGDYTGFTIRY